MKDDYPPVAIAAAAISWQLFPDNESEYKLKEFCQSDNMDLALMTINFLLYTDKKEPFIGIIKVVHGKAKSNYNVKAACMDFLGSMGIVKNNLEN